jgi:hypothetical protein
MQTPYTSIGIVYNLGVFVRIDINTSIMIQEPCHAPSAASRPAVGYIYMLVRKYKLNECIHLYTTSIYTDHQYIYSSYESTN